MSLQGKRKCIHSLLFTKQHTIRSLTICSISAKPADVAPSSALRERLDDCKHTPLFKQCLQPTGHSHFTRPVILHINCVMTNYYTYRTVTQRCSKRYKCWFHTVLSEYHKIVSNFTFPF